MESKSKAGGIVKYFYELGQLKRVKRSGWWIAGVKDPESVAEHSFRASIIAYVLARLEGAKPEKAAAMVLFHDVPEARTNDPHRIVQRYFDREGVDLKVTQEQLERLDEGTSAQIEALFAEMEEEESLEARVARDADILECLVQAREYQALGVKDVGDWIVNCRAALQTDSAKRIAEACLEMEPGEWWKGLKK